VPMLLVRSEPHHIARSHFLDRAAITLNPTETRHDNQGLAERMGVPRRACARLKGDQRAAYAGRIGGLNSGSICTVPVNHSAGPLPDGCAPLRLISIVKLSVAGFLPKQSASRVATHFGR
jgi:hypothetical protein